MTEIIYKERKNGNTNELRNVSIEIKNGAMHIFTLDFNLDRNGAQETIELLKEIERKIPGPHRIDITKIFEETITEYSFDGNQ